MVGDLNLQGWLTNDRAKSIPPTQHKGSVAKGGNPALAGGNPKTDPGG